MQQKRPCAKGQRTGILLDPQETPGENPQETPGENPQETPGGESGHGDQVQVLRVP